MEKWIKMGKMLSGFIRPKTFPLAVKVIGKNEDEPKDIKQPLRDLGIKVTVCQAISMARRYGWSIHLKPQDCCCPIALLLYGWVEIEDEKEVWNLYVKSGVNKTLEASKKRLEALPRFKKGEVKGVVFSPLEWTKIQPDMVMVYCNPAQLVRFIHATLYEEGGKLTFSTVGGGGSCSEGIIKTVLTQKPQIVLPGIGDRVFSMTQDDEIIFTIPAEKLEKIVEDLKIGHEKEASRYPIPQYLRFQPVFPKPYLELEEKFRLVNI